MRSTPQISGRDHIDQTIHFGVGCFHLGLKRTPPYKISYEQYVSELRNTLQAITNISKLEIKTDKFDNFEFEIKEPVEKLDDGGDCFPPYQFTDIQFEIYIPSRIQTEIMDDLDALSLLKTERFLVTIQSGYHLPITFIELLNPSGEVSHSSEAVVCVREFLKRELAKSKSKSIRFEMLGPSPFHGNFSLQSAHDIAKDDMRWRFRVQQSKRLGYDQIIFEFNPALFPNLIEAKRKLYFEVVNELGLFYEVQRLEVKRINIWANIQEYIAKLTGIQKTKGIGAIWGRLFKMRKLLDQLLVEVTNFESSWVFTKQIVQRDYDQQYPNSRNTYLKSYVDEQVKRQFQYPTREAAQLISFFETRSSKRIDIIVALLAAILGGAIGALLTGLVDIRHGTIERNVVISPPVINKNFRSESGNPNTLPLKAEHHREQHGP